MLNNVTCTYTCTCSYGTTCTCEKKNMYFMCTLNYKKHALLYRPSIIFLYNFNSQCSNLYLFFVFFFNRRRANRRTSNRHAATLGWTMLGGSIHCTVHKTNLPRNQNNTLRTKKLFSSIDKKSQQPEKKNTPKSTTQTQNLFHWYCKKNTLPFAGSLQILHTAGRTGTLTCGCPSFANTW